jgi:CubicO group peptidase (beta-lactamase class C family)/peptidoglycan/LPS O-acetylase OafA/YrhL
MLGGTLALALLLLPGETDGLRGDALATLGYVMNWRLIFSQQSYFDPMVRPSLLQNLWSLAVEEQFYLLWPLLFIAGMRYLRRIGLLLATLSLAVASVALMAWLYEPGGDPSRIYYGTDTRAAGLLIGAALALAWSPGRAPSGRGAGLLLDAAGLVALAGLIAGVHFGYEYHPLLYRGGFLLIALGTATVIVTATHPRARLVPGALAWQPLRWIGLRSYGIYLWHWPIFMLTRPYQDVPLDGWPLLLLRLAIVIPLAALSYHFVELPIRRGELDRAWAAFWSRRRAKTIARSNHLMPARRPSAAILSLVAVFTAACSVSSGERPTAQPAAAATAVAIFSTAAATPLPTAVPPAPTASATAVPTASATAVPPAPTATAAPTAAPATSTPAMVLTEAAPPTAATAATEAAPPTAATAATEAAAQEFDPELAAVLQRILDQTVADGYIPGAVLSVSVPGMPPWSGASGIANRKTGQPIEPATRVRIASISKVFTAALILQLVEDGLIELDAPVATWFPDLLPNADKVTVRHLLSHTSGLYDYLEDRNFVNRAYRQPDRAWAPREMVDYAAGFPAAFRPGAKGAWDYSSTNYVILGMIAEQVTGNSLGQEMRRRIFEPLELKQTFFAPEEPVQGEQAHGYSNAIDQTNAPMSIVFATASIVSTTDDVRRFIEALFDGRVLAPETLDLMKSFVGGKGQYNMPNLEYGLGVMRNRLPVGAGPDGRPRPAEASRVMGHIGGFGGFRAAVWSAPESGITIALGINQAATDPNKLATRVFDAILTHLGR